MRSMQICISCVVFAMEILSLHRGNISVDIRIRDNLTEVNLKRCIIIWEKRTLSCHMHVLAEEDAVWGMTRMCWISHTITDQPALITFLLQQDDFLRIQYGVLRVRISFIFFMYNQYKGCSQGTNISVYNSHDGCYTGLWTPLNFCAVCCGLTRQYLQEVVYTVYITCTYGQRRILMLLATPHSSTDLVSNVWAGIVDYVIGPCAIKDRLDAVKCADCLEEKLPPLLKNVPLYVRESIWF
jgi:hypothetical protein